MFDLRSRQRFRARPDTVLSRRGSRAGDGLDEPGGECTLTIPSTMVTPAVDAVETFRIAVDDAVLSDLRDRLKRTRLPDQIEGTGWEYGIPVGYLGSLVEYWRDRYDWRREEARFNSLPHFRTRIDGQSIHFVHARSRHVDALPLLLTHGWPGSFFEFFDVIPRLTDPESFGGRAADAFHVIVPSLPGYGFSGCPALRAGT